MKKNYPIKLTPHLRVLQSDEHSLKPSKVTIGDIVRVNGSMGMPSFFAKVVGVEKVEAEPYQLFVENWNHVWQRYDVGQVDIRGC
jgi:hypothetical protein